ncbi:hypothetical protein ACHAQJ_004882 [Trichoderma viride]
MATIRSSQRLIHLLRECDQPVDGYQYIQVDNVIAQGPAPYANYVHRNGRSILCMYNFADLDTNGQNRMHWSDLMAISCARAMSANGQSDMTSIENIWRITIVNEETNSVIKAIDRRRSSNLADKERYIDLTDDDADFFSLVGTVHGKGPARC